MRNRDYKQYAAGEYYHIYNRGNAKQDIFLDGQDFGFFLLRLRQGLFPDSEHAGRGIPLPPNSFSLISYCLMPNHFHLLVRQSGEIPTSKLLAKVCTSFSIFFNKKYGRVGQVFQDQFKQVLVDSNDYLRWLSAYIHNNPKVAGFVKKSEDYKWSSYGEYLNLTHDNLCEKEVILSQFSLSLQGASLQNQMRAYKNFVEDSFKIIKNKKDLEHFLLDHEE